MNPLLNLGVTPPFAEITAEVVEPAFAALLEQAKATVAAIANQPGERTYENTILALDRATEPLDQALAVTRHLEAVRTTPEFRTAFNAIEPPVMEFYSSIPLDDALWTAVKQVKTSPPGVHRRFLEKTIRGFVRSGADLPPATKEQLQKLDVELTKVTTKFSENVLDETNRPEWIVTDEAKLAGLPPSAREAARASAESKGKAGWRFTLQSPSYTAVMTYLDDRGLREEMWRAYNTRAASGERDNRPLIARILELRREKAKLLGFDHFADLVLEERMAKTGAKALAFLEELFSKTVDRFEGEKRTLEQFAGFALEPWDVGYWAEKQRQALYDFDEEALRPYFPLDRVVDGMFRIFEELLAIEIIERKDAAGWDPAVKCFEIRRDGVVAGIFYSDWFPRDNKRGGAWMDTLHTGGPSADGFEPHVGLICGNLTPPVGQKPSLLTHREVETIFHEFGHLLHQCLSTVEVRSLAGTHVAWDWVELPSQIMENWCWEREALDRFARHWETGEAIPDELFERMKRARNFRAATMQMRQLSFGITDLRLHIEYDSARDGDVVSYVRRVMEPMSSAPLPADYAMITSFTHLFADPVAYGAGYYSYKWSEVLDADAFSRFRREGIFNRAVGLEYRERILAAGDGDDPEALYRSFMGRDPDLAALLERNGLLETAPLQ
jgi:oligopeptidase A